MAGLADRPTNLCLHDAVKQRAQFENLTVNDVVRDASHARLIIA